MERVDGIGGTVKRAVWRVNMLIIIAKQRCPNIQIAYLTVTIIRVYGLTTPHISRVL